MTGDYDNFWPGCLWPLLGYTEYFSPPDLNFNEMNDEKVDLIVNYAIENLSFIVILEEFEDSIKRLNMAFALELDASEVSKRRNEMPKDLFPINELKTETKEFFDKLLIWENKIYNKLLAARRWQVAVPYVKQPGEETDYAITQYTLPKDFDPDAYFTEHAGADLAHLDDIWKKRKWAMLHYVAQEEKLDPAVFNEFRGTEAQGGGASFSSS